MTNFRINQSVENKTAPTEFRCTKRISSRKFGEVIDRSGKRQKTASAETRVSGDNTKQSVSRITIRNLQNSTSHAGLQTNTEIAQFAIQVISQIVGLISHFLKGLGLESGVPQNLGGGNQDAGLPVSGGGYQPSSGGNGIPININIGSNDQYGQNYDDDVLIISCPEPHPGDQPSEPVDPTPPVVTPREKPKAGDTYIRLGPIDNASKTGDVSGADRPNPREISNTVSNQDIKQTSNANNASDLLWSWGQFIDHDMILTKEGETPANISVPPGDPNFDPAHTGRSFIPFTRSHANADQNGNREQVNEQTALIDGSMVYGATAEKTETLRTHEGGRLKLDENGHLLPEEKEKVLSGDPRAAEQPGLLSLQTLFAREHNRQAGLIAKKYPDWDDNQIFDEARRRVTNQLQAITYNEFLPVLLGGEAPVTSRVKYDPATVDGQVSSEFSTAAFRLGHTMVNETVAYKDDQGSLKQAGLDEVFFKPEFTHREGIGSILAGQSDQKAQAVDPMIVDALRNRLFGPPQAGGPAMDLASLNIQRGRDHNIATYNEMREAMGYHRIESFDDPVFQDGVGAKLAEVYDSPDDIDLWIGGLSEKPLGNSMLGETFTSIVDEQFGRTAAADPNFYTKTASADEIAWLNQLSLADIVRANSQDAYIDDTPFTVD